MPTQRKIVTLVLLSATTGCGASSSKSAAPAPAPSRLPVPEVAAAPQAAAEPVATVQLVSSPAPAAKPAPATPPVIKPDGEQPENLLRLRSELYRADELTLHASHAKFRALCDANGYPVVGNVASKSMRHDVTSYCEDVREQLVVRGNT
jgi:hypothetical protein